MQHLCLFCLHSFINRSFCSFSGISLRFTDGFALKIIPIMFLYCSTFSSDSISSPCTYRGTLNLTYLSLKRPIKTR